MPEYKIDFIEAQDDNTPQSDLVYKIYRSDVPITSDTLSQATLLDQAPDVTSFTINLDVGVHNINVVVEDTEGLKTFYENISITVEEAIVPPANPPTYSIIETDKTRVRVNYTLVDGATAYDFRLIGGQTILGVVNDFFIDNLEPGSTYQLQMKARNSAGSSVWGASVFFTTDQVDIPPTSPEILSATIGLTTIVITNSAVDTASSYEYRLDLDDATITDVGLVNEFTISGLSQNTLYSVQIRARNTGGPGSWSDPIEYTTDAEVSGIPVINQIDILGPQQQILVGFTGVAHAEGYDYRTNGGGTVDVFDVAEFIVSELTENTHTIEVRGHNSYGNGDWSAISTFTTDWTDPALSNDIITVESATASQVDISFVKATDNITPQANLVYELYIDSLADVSSEASILQLTPAQTGTDLASFSIAGLTEGVTIHGNVLVRDQADNVTIYGAFTAVPVTMGVQISEPENLAEIPQGLFTVSGTVTSNFDIVSLERRINEEIWIALSASNSFSFDLDTDVLDTYLIEVRAEDADGIISTDSVTITIVDVTDPVPGNTGITTEENITTAAFDAVFTQATDNTTSGANLQYSLYTGDPVLLADLATVESQTLQETASGVDRLTASGLAQDTTYSYIVLVQDESGNKALYSVGSVQTAFLDAPVIDTANVTTAPDSAYIPWLVVANAAGYNYRINDGATVDVGNVLNTTVEDLQPGEYTFEIQAYNGANFSSWTSQQIILPDLNEVPDTTETLSFTA